MKQAGLIWGFIALSAFQTKAIIVADYETAESDQVLLANNLNWGGVYNINNSSGVALSEHWILTAAHVADDVAAGTVQIGNTTYSGVSTHYHTGGADLALIHVPGATFNTYYDRSNFTTDQMTVIIGYGNTGTIPSSTTFSDGGTGRGTKRWGTNNTATDPAQLNVNLSFAGYTSSEVLMRFDTDITFYEAGVGQGDSGGGVFVNDNGTWKLAGIMNAHLSNADETQDYIGAVNLAQYDSWITETIPEPATMTIFGIGLFGLLGYRRRYEWLIVLHKEELEPTATEIRACANSQLGNLLTRLIPVRAADPYKNPKADTVGALLVRLIPVQPMPGWSAPETDRIGDWLLKVDRIAHSQGPRTKASQPQ